MKTNSRSGSPTGSRSLRSTRSELFRKHLLDSAYIQPDRRAHDRDDDSRRRYKRATLDSEAKLRAPSKLGVDAQVQNLSAGGCCLKLKFGSFAIGETVWFKVAGIENWQGTVRWIDGATIGVEFDRPLYPAVFDHLVAQNKRVSVDTAA